MRKYRTVTVEQEELDGIICNACGGEIKRLGANVWGDHLSVEKLWGYASPFDGEGHSFEICADCYKNWIKSFNVPLK